MVLGPAWETISVMCLQPLASSNKAGRYWRQGEAPVLVTSAGIRPFVRGIVERFRSQTSVLSQAEIHPRARLKTVGSI